MLKHFITGFAVLLLALFVYDAAKAQGCTKFETVQTYAQEQGYSLDLSVSPEDVDLMRGAIAMFMNVPEESVVTFGSMSVFIPSDPEQSSVFVLMDAEGCVQSSLAIPLKEWFTLKAIYTALKA